MQPVGDLDADDAAVSIEELRAALIGAMHGQRRHLDLCAARHGLSGQAAIALLQLHRPWPGSEPQPSDVEGDDTADGLAMRDLAGRISCDPSQLTGIADRLEASELVERQPSAVDRRVKMLVLTERGVQVATELADEINRDAPGFGALDDQERVQLLALLRKLASEE
jgi:DNA-binding MarR family transcriptional regulator